MTKTEIFSKSEIKQMKSEAYESWTGGTPDNPVIHYLLGEAVCAGIGHVLAAETVPYTMALGIYLGACDTYADSLEQETYELYNDAYDAMNEYGYDLIKIDIGYKDTYVPAQRGWDGGVLPIEVHKPIVVAFHTNGGWIMV